VLFQLRKEAKFGLLLINYGYQIPKFRNEQDKFLQQLSQHWQFTTPKIKPNPNPDFLGNPLRNN
jgi:hypothetical protein